MSYDCQSQMERGMRGWPRQPTAVHRSSCSGSSWPSTPKPTCQCNPNRSQVPSMWPYLQIRLWTSKPYACSQQTFLILRCIVVVDIDGQRASASKQASKHNCLYHFNLNRLHSNKYLILSFQSARTIADYAAMQKNLEAASEAVRGY